jgi:hypothetical protein
LLQKNNTSQKGIKQNRSKLVYSYYWYLIFIISLVKLLFYYDFVYVL